MIELGIFRRRKDEPAAGISSELGVPPGGDLPIWPSGMARYSDGILEVTTGDGMRVAAGDVVEIGTKPPRAGRLSLEVKYRAGLNKVGRSYWVERHNEAALTDLVRRVSEDLTPS